MPKAKSPIRASWPTCPFPSLIPSRHPDHRRGENKVFEAKAGETLKIPLKVTWRNEFTGTSIKLKAYGADFAGMKEFDIPIKAATARSRARSCRAQDPARRLHARLLRHRISKYRYNPAAVALAEAAQKKAEQEAAAAAEKRKKLAADRRQAAKIAAEKQKHADAANGGGDQAHEDRQRKPPHRRTPSIFSCRNRSASS